MTAKARIALKMSEKRQRLNELLAIDEPTDENRGELAGLTGELQNLEVELRGAIVAEGETETRTEGTPEARELRDLVGRCSVGAIFSAVLEHRNAEGPEAELQKHYNLSGNQVPLDLLEYRAVTPAPADVGQNQAAIIPGVFPDSVSAFLGVDMPRVSVGDAVFPVLTQNAEVKTPAENAAAGETTGAFSADVLSPARLQASFFYSREDRARFSGMDSALRENLSMALADGLDKQVLAGTNGLLTGTVLANHAAANATTFDQYISQFGYGRVDGIYASMASALRVVMGAKSYEDAGSTYRTSDSEQPALERLMEITGGVRVSAHVPAVSGNKQNAVIRRGTRRDMVAPVWEGVTLIPDEVTKAGSGQIVVTAVMLHAIKLLRAGGFYKQEVNLS